MAAQIVSSPGVRASGSEPIVVSEKSFALNGNNVSYRFHVDEKTGDLISDHFAGRVTENPPALVGPNGGGWSTQAHIRREFPDLGRGDFGVPAVQIRQSAGYALCDFKYKSHTITDGKPALEGLPHTYGVKEGDVKTLVLHLYDSHSSVAADLYYSVFPKHDAIVRSVKITNEGSEQIVVMRLASLSIDLPSSEYDMIGLHGEWTRERSRNRRKIQPGIQGFSSSTGYSSHYHNPFLSVVSSSTTETHGDAWGMALVYTGSFSAEVEQNPQGLTRAMMGMNPHQFSWPLKKGESLTSPECISVYSNAGTGGMSRKYHRLMREHLIRSKFVNETRPVLLNSWEGLYFNFDESTIYKLAQESAKLGAKLFVLDDGWFGVKYPRVNDTTGLGDWVVNPDRFPDGLGPLVEKVRNLSVAGSDEKLQFGLWVEPEMVSPKSALYDEHPDWAMYAGPYPRTEARSQLVLNLGLKEVQDYIIDSMSDILKSAPITYIKWDNNRAIHENSSPDGFHLYMLGLYRVLEELTARFPDVLWEGCASGGGRFDAGMLYYWPQIWTSDNMDPLDRLHIQFGTSLAYPASTMGAHIAAVPNDVTGRTTPMTFRAHVAMMGGSFGLELNPDKMPEDDKALIPDLIALAEKINPIVIKGDLWRLNLPENSNYPAAMYVSEDGSKAVLFAFQVRRITVMNLPVLRLQGLDPSATYSLDGKERFSGETLMNGGIQYRFNKDYDSKIILIERV